MLSYKVRFLLVVFCCLSYGLFSGHGRDRVGGCGKGTIAHA